MIASLRPRFDTKLTVELPDCSANWRFSSSSSSSSGGGSSRMVVPAAALVMLMVADRGLSPSRLSAVTA